MNARTKVNFEAEPAEPCAVQSPSFCGFDFSTSRLPPFTSSECSAVQAAGLDCDGVYSCVINIIFLSCLIINVAMLCFFPSPVFSAFCCALLLAGKCFAELFYFPVVAHLLSSIDLGSPVRLNLYTIEGDEDELSTHLPASCLHCTGRRFSESVPSICSVREKLSFCFRELRA